MLSLDDCRGKAPLNTKTVVLTLEGGMSIEVLLFVLHICEAFSLKDILRIILPENKGQYIKVFLGLLETGLDYT